MPIALSLLALLVALVLGVVYFRGDRRCDLRRCPLCRYDMARVPGMTCPECGSTATAEARFHYTKRKRRFAVMSAFGLLVAAGIFMSGVMRHGGVVGMLPRPVLAWLLEQSVPALAKPPGADVAPILSLPFIQGLPAHLNPNRTLWQRLSWNQRYVHVVRDWGDLVATDDPARVLADLPRIHAALNQMQKWHQAYAGTAWVDGWVVMDEIDRQRQRIESHLTRSVTIPAHSPGAAPITLDRNELLMLAFQPPRNECGGIGLRGGAYIAAPQPYLAAMATLDHAGAQRYALERLGPEPSGAVDIDALLARIEAGDPDRKTRDVATTIRLWRTSLLKSVR